MTAKEHNRLVGIFLMAHGGLQAFAMIIICIVYGILGSAMFIGGRQGEEQMVGLVFIAVIVFLAILSLVFVLPQLLGGYKLFKEKPNARTWGIVGSIISCLSFPLGTAAGVYGLWFLFGDEGRRFYLGGGNQQGQNRSQNQGGNQQNRGGGNQQQGGNQGNRSQKPATGGAQGQQGGQQPNRPQNQGGNQRNNPNRQGGGGAQGQNRSQNPGGNRPNRGGGGQGGGQQQR